MEKVNNKRGKKSKNIQFFYHPSFEKIKISKDTPVPEMISKENLINVPDKQKKDEEIRRIIREINLLKHRKVHSRKKY